MSKRINYQTIVQDGKPAFVVIPYQDFIDVYHNLEHTIPNDVVGLMVHHDISRIRAWREYLGFTQAEVAVQLGITQAALSQIESKNSRPRKATFMKLAKLYGLSLEQLR